MRPAWLWVVIVLSLFIGAFNGFTAYTSAQMTLNPSAYISKIERQIDQMGQMGGTRFDVPLRKIIDDARKMTNDPVLYAYAVADLIVRVIITFILFLGIIFLFSLRRAGALLLQFALSMQVVLVLVASGFAIFKVVRMFNGVQVPSMIIVPALIGAGIGMAINLGIVLIPLITLRRADKEILE